MNMTKAQTTLVGETDPRTPMGIGGPNPFWFGEGGGRTKSGSRQYTRAVLPSFGLHGCVKPYCCLFVCIEFLLRSDGRYQTERGSVSGVSNEPNHQLTERTPPPLRCAWASFYTLKGSPTSGNVDERGRNGKRMR